MLAIFILNLDQCFGIWLRFYDAVFLLLLRRPLCSVERNYCAILVEGISNIEKICVKQF